MNRLKPRSALPHMERIEHFAWREGWWQGLMVGVVIGLAVGVIFTLHR